MAFVRTLTSISDRCSNSKVLNWSRQLFVSGLTCIFNATKKIEKKVNNFWNRTLHHKKRAYVHRWIPFCSQCLQYLQRDNIVASSLPPLLHNRDLCEVQYVVSACHWVCDGFWKSWLSPIAEETFEQFLWHDCCHFSREVQTQPCMHLLSFRPKKIMYTFLNVSLQIHKYPCH